MISHRFEDVKNFVNDWIEDIQRPFLYWEGVTDENIHSSMYHHNLSNLDRKTKSKLCELIHSINRMRNSDIKTFDPTMHIFLILGETDDR